MTTDTERAVADLLAAYEPRRAAEIAHGLGATKAVIRDIYARQHRRTIAQMRSEGRDEPTIRDRLIAGGVSRSAAYRLLKGES